MPLIQFPNIPNVPGVPALVRQANAVISSAFTLLKGDAAAVFGLVQEARWGIYTEAGQPVALADSVNAFEFSKMWRLSDYPVEEGGFETYNKVETPYQQRVTLAKGGTDDDRATFLAALDAAVASLDLFTVMTPDGAYANASLIGYNMRRHARGGVTLLLVEVMVEEVRVTATSAFTQTASPSGSAQASGGTVQAQTPSASQATAALSGAL